MDTKKLVKREIDAISVKYFSDLAVARGSERIEKSHCLKGYALINGEPYDLYSYDSLSRWDDFNYLFMPRNIDFSKGICGDVYRLGAYTDGYYFDRINFSGDTFTKTIYDLSEDDGLKLNKQVRKYNYNKSMFGKLYKSYDYKDLFYYRYLHGPSKKYTSKISWDFVSITKDDSATKCKVLDMTDAITAFRRFIDDDDFELVDDTTSTLLDIADSYSIGKEKINQ